MKKLLLLALFTVLLFLMPNVNFGQAPDLGAASGFVKGDVGTNVGAFYGFPPGTLIGQKHVEDQASAVAAPFVLTAYQYLDQLTCILVKTTPLGGGDILLPNIYCIGEAAVLDGDLTLDGQNDPNSLFIFQIDGAFATTVGSRILLINGASLCNVWWQVNGAFSLGGGSVFRGNVLAAGAIHLLQGSALYGRALSTQGAIDLHNNVVTLGLPAMASTISANNTTTFCVGDSVLLSGNVGGTWSTGDTTGILTVKTSGDYFVTNTTICGSINSNHIIVTVNPLPIASIISALGPVNFCLGDSVILIGNVGGLWNNGEATPTIKVKTSGDFFVTNTNECGSITSNHINVVVNDCGPFPSIPISTWALVLGGVMITLLVFIRYRRNI